MAKRTKVEDLIVFSWEEANHALRQIGELAISIKIKESKAQLAINEITAEKVEAVRPLVAERERLIAGLKLFCESRMGKEKIRTRVLDFGTVYIRKTQDALKTLKKVTWDNVVERLEQAGLKQFIQEKKTVKKDELKKFGFSTEELAELGVCLSSDDEFSFEVNEAKFAEPDTTESRAGGAPAA